MYGIMLEEVPDRQLSLGDRVVVDDLDFNNHEVYTIVFFPHGDRHDVVVQSERDGFLRIAPFRMLRRSDRPFATLKGYAVAFEDGHAEYWAYNPSMLYGEQILALKIVGVEPIEIPIKPFETRIPNRERPQ